MVSKQLKKMIILDFLCPVQVKIRSHNLEIERLCIVEQSFKHIQISEVIRLKNGDIFAFCEVKPRAEGSLTTPAEAVDKAKQRRLIRAAEIYLQTTGLSDAPVRFDVAEVKPLDSGRWMVHIIRGAFLA